MRTIQLSSKTKEYNIFSGRYLFLVFLGYSNSSFAEPSVNHTVNDVASFIVYSIISIATLAMIIRQHRKGNKPLWKTVLIWACAGILAAVLATPLLVFFFIAYHGRTM
jgi:uncharacterized protein (DUF983 family)